MPNNSPKRAFGSTEKSRSKSISVDLPTAQKMIPLIESIVRDILGIQQELNSLEPERDRLERHRRDLAWEERQRRYQLKDEITQRRRDLHAALGELKALGVTLSDRSEGRVELPTRIKGRPAVFSWKAGEADINFWHYPGEEERRPIPADWRDGKDGPTRPQW